MAREWRDLTRMTEGEAIVVERVRLGDRGIHLEGEFELPPLANLAMEDQVFVAAFVKSHGSIKQMEQLFGVSYPTIKNRLNSISEKLSFVDITPPPEPNDALDALARGVIDVDEAVRRLKK